MPPLSLSIYDYDGLSTNDQTNLVIEYGLCGFDKDNDIMYSMLPCQLTVSFFCTFGIFLVSYLLFKSFKKVVKIQSRNQVVAAAQDTYCIISLYLIALT